MPQASECRNASIMFEKQAVLEKYHKKNVYLKVVDNSSKHIHKNSRYFKRPILTSKLKLNTFRGSNNRRGTVMNQPKVSFRSPTSKRISMNKRVSLIATSDKAIAKKQGMILLNTLNNLSSE